MNPSPVAIVTGASRGIGAAIAQRLAKDGHAVVVNYAGNADEAAKVVAAITAAGGQAAAIQADVADASAVRRLFDETERLYGRIDVLVNNAGINIRKPPHMLELDEWSSVVDTNLTSAFLCSKAVHPAMKAAGGGKIINIGSMLSIFGAAFAPAYGASKGGVVQLTKSLATAWAKDNIQVNAVLPGWIDTELTRKAREEVSGLNSLVLMRTPAKRWGVPDDLSGIAVFLGSAASDFVNGTAIPVDGGYSVQV